MRDRQEKQKKKKVREERTALKAATSLLPKASHETQTPNTIPPSCVPGPSRSQHPDHKKGITSESIFVTCELLCSNRVPGAKVVRLPYTTALVWCGVGLWQPLAPLP